MGDNKIINLVKVIVNSFSILYYPFIEARQMYCFRGIVWI